MKLTNLFLAVGIVALTACGGGDNNADKSGETKEAPKSMVSEEPAEETLDTMNWVGPGPVKELTLPDEIDQDLVAQGEKVYQEKCLACHKPDVKFIGPAPKGIFERRNPAWVMNMILDPELMVKEDPIAKDLLRQFSAPMANQNLTEEEARAVVEYFRTL